MHFNVVVDPADPEKAVKVTPPVWTNSKVKVMTANKTRAIALLGDVKKRFPPNALLSAFAYCKYHTDLGTR